MKKRLFIKDADENIEYEVNELDVDEDEEEKGDDIDSAIPDETTEVEEKKEEEIEETPAPEAVVFTKEEISALKDLILLVPELKEMLEKCKEEGHEEEKEEEKPEEEIEEIEDVEEIDEDKDQIEDSIGRLEKTHGKDSFDPEMIEAINAERFKKYYNGGN